MDDVKYFAGKALQGLLSKSTLCGNGELVREAYDIALLMADQFKKYESPLEAEIKEYAKNCLEFVKGEFEIAKSVYIDFLNFYQLDDKKVSMPKFIRSFKRIFCEYIDYEQKKVKVAPEIVEPRIVFTNLRFTDRD